MIVANNILLLLISGGARNYVAHIHFHTSISRYLAYSRRSLQTLLGFGLGAPPGAQIPNPRSSGGVFQKRRKKSMDYMCSEEDILLAQEYYLTLGQQDGLPLRIQSLTLVLPVLHFVMRAGGGTWCVCVCVCVCAPYIIGDAWQGGCRETCLAGLPVSSP